MLSYIYDSDSSDENEGSIISSLIAQLRVGMDLSRVTFPTFVLEPRSMLERITDFMSHPELIFGQAIPYTTRCILTASRVLLGQRTATTPRSASFVSCST